MKIRGFIWLDEVIEKIERKHGVRQADVRELFAKRPRFRFVEKGYRKAENVYAAFGQNNAGRHLVVFFVLKTSGNALILSARDMTRAERKRHAKP